MRRPDAELAVDLLVPLIPLGDSATEPAPMQPDVLGATDQELTELQTLTCLSKMWPHALSASELIDAALESLSAAAEVERVRLLQLRGRDTVAKRNRRNMYLDPFKRGEWRERSHRFLERRVDIAQALSTDALYSAVLMQHLIDLDAADAALPPGRRCSEDGYRDGVSGQFLLDAPRGRYTVEGEVFHFAKAYAQSAEDEEAFVKRLLAAVRRVSPPALLARVTTTMSQSGLAALERATLCRAAVSGGAQVVDYTLEEADNGLHERVLVTLQVNRRGFSEYVIDGIDDMSPMTCDSTTSGLLKAATVAFDTNGNIDVSDVVERVEIRRDGQLLPAESLRATITAAPARPPRSGAGGPGKGLRGGLEAMNWECLRQRLRTCTGNCVRRLCSRRARTQAAREVVPTEDDETCTLRR